MARRKKLLVPGITIVALLLSYGGLQLWLWKSPLIVLGGQRPAGEIFDRQTAVGRVFADGKLATINATKK